jgi:glutamyl-tRNA reductase
MWQELTLVHRPTVPGSPPLGGEGNLWRTCLRELLFLEPGTLTAPGEPSASGLAAHQLLVEICGGLHSPLFGETEVFGQFRAFRERQSWDPLWEALLDSVEEDVRKLRRTHLKGLGAQSYGSLARRHLTAGKPVVILGAGRLARDLLPWLSEFEVILAARSPEKAGAPAVAMAELGSNPRLREASWIIAAPLANETLLGFWRENPPGLVLDFRGESSFSECPASRYLALRAIYEELESVKILHQKKRSEALAFAAELSQRRSQAVLHRPYGWDDAFA